ncbi:carbohydrate esterase family 16 protein [Zasmidium cellare ATCC 36951]|uniref:Carbohydrate esterase family 16 protein n=1 Tax=Zasmidium cellare ATCC 36951 TaxID=1080233 RepID=A0A6A6CEY8_ZASCE|nr:carbohydrate esterase family 16 protein [Zasmidium cellare ATCC 36951]KAF2164492.1 carbohydrate esterase family 16 protein [Zasmidium cellare ATCC 36951]
MRFLVLVAAATVVGATPVKRQQPQSNPILHFFVFGDSYSSSGFNETSPAPSISQPLGFPPLGTSPDDLLGNPLIANQTSSNGPNWVEFLTARWNTTTTLTYDFAISGASIPDGYTDQALNIYEPKYSSLYAGDYGNTSSQIPISNQSSSGSGGETLGMTWTSNTSIFASWVGINDINWCSLLFTTTPDVPFSECLPPRLDAYFNLMDNLYITGARNFFFINLPPLQRAPMVFEKGQKIIDNYAQGVALWNQNLFPAYVRNFTAQHPGSRAVVYDAHSAFSTILDHPRYYGFRDSTCYSCIGCRNVTGCFWSNNYHPVWQVHDRLSRDMVANLTAVGWPVQQPVS